MPELCLQYKYAPNADCDFEQGKGKRWRRSYHGIPIGGFNAITLSGMLLPSIDGENHSIVEDTPGVNVTPQPHYAHQCAMPQHWFGDEYYHRGVLILQSDINRMLKQRKDEDGNITWVLPSDAIKIEGIQWYVNTHVMHNEKRISTWTPRHEVLFEHQPAAGYRALTPVENWGQGKIGRASCRERV